MAVRATGRAGSSERPPRVKTRLRKGDTVIVITGKERGKTGKILRVIPEKNRAVVEGLNKVKRHRRPTGAQSPGGIVEKEAAIHLSNLMMLCDKTNKPTRVGVRRDGQGNAVRFSRRSGEALER